MIFDFENKCRALKPGNNLFKEFKRLCNYKKKTRLPPVFKIGDELISDNHLQAEEFAKYFESVYNTAFDFVEISDREEAKARILQMPEQVLCTFSAAEPACIDEHAPKHFRVNRKDAEHHTIVE